MNMLIADTYSEEPVMPLPTTLDYSKHIELNIYNLQRRCSASTLKGKSGFLMISIKNKNFSNRLIEYYFDFVNRYLESGFVTIVDTPYIHNIYARYRDEVTRQIEIKKLERIADENNRRITRLLGKSGVRNIEQISWANLEKQVPEWLHNEVESAFNGKGKFYNDILERTKEIIPQGILDNDNLESYSQFLVKETPVLCTQYYLKGDRIVDIYPGEIPDFLWKIESGYYSDELPGISEIASKSSGLVYIDFRLKK